MHKVSKPLVLTSTNWPGMVRDEALYAEMTARLKPLAGPYTMYQLRGALKGLGRADSGNGQLSIRGRDNAIIAWDVSLEVVTMFTMLIADPAVKVWHCKPNLYPLKEIRVPLPIAYQVPAKDFARPHWVPIAFDFKHRGADR
ncbi:MAG: hypothetical protein QM753_08755 [Thermomicrobiales bacterium]